jgi:dTDP-4-dehydrorhamnose reductase
MSNILVTGSNGQLGSEIQQLVSEKVNFFFTDINELDITDEKAIIQFCRKHSIKTIINCAAYTAVDKAESEFKLADKINNLAVKYLSRVSKEQQIKLIHVSTDYVFTGTNYRPYIESDKPNPQSVYGSTKLAGERAITEVSPEGAIIIRTSWVYSSFGNNFVKTMRHLGAERDSLNVIFDQVGTPTYAKDLAKAILEIVNAEKENINPELYHFSNEGVASWYDFAKEIMEIEKLTCQVLPIETKDYPTPAKRPHYSLLNKSKIKQEFGIKIPHWKDSLKECLKEIRHESN